MILFHLKSFLSLGYIKARKLQQSKRVPFPPSEHFLGRTGDPVHVTSWDPAGSAVHWHLTKAWILQKGLKRGDMFWVETLILPNIFKNSFNSKDIGHFLKSNKFFLLLQLRKWMCQMTYYMLAYISLSKCLLNWTTKLCPNLYIN